MLNARSSVQCDGVCVNVGADTHARQGMDHLHLPTVDLFCAPKVEAMFRGVDYISKHVAAGAAPRPSPNLFICSQFSVVVYPLKAPTPHSTAAPAGKKVYIHCKAGRGRSASLACCYLIASGEHARAAADLSRCAQVVPAAAIARYA